MKPHTTAWNAIKDEILGEVCEVARRVPWGFKADCPPIHNVTCDQFLETDKVFGTVILHILIGEGESLDIFEKVFQHAYKHALKVIVLEHSPSSQDWKGNNNVTKERIDFLQKLLDESGERIRTKDLGRNVVHLFTTVKPLFIDQVNNNYIKENLNKSWKGTKKAAWYSDGYYTHTSESLISQEIIDKLPVDKDFYWVIGGLMFLGNIHNIPDRRHKLIDSVFKQCLLARIAIEPDSDELVSKINTIQENLGSGILSKINSAPVYIDAFGNKNHWCNFHKAHGCEGVLSKISSIEHLSISDLKTSDQIIYTSTVPLPAHTHLKFKNWVITCTEGIKWDVPWLMEKVEEGYSSPLRKHDFWDDMHKSNNRIYVTDPDLNTLLSYNNLRVAKTGLIEGDVLVIGAGGGSCFKDLSNKARSISILDISQEALKKFKKYGNIYTPETLSNLSDGSIDIALSRLVAQHMSDEDLMHQLKHVFRGLKDNGLLSIQFAGSPDVGRNDREESLNTILLGGRCRSIDTVKSMICKAGGIVIGFDTTASGINSAGRWDWHLIHARKAQAQVQGREVPKKVFFYWGNDRMSWLRYMTLYSFRKFNPDWEMELHVSHIDMKDKYWKTPEDQDFHSYAGKNWLPEVEKLGVTFKECPVFVEGAGPSHNSNFFKWNELATNGGIYCDMDILFVNPIEDWYESIKYHSTGLSYKSTGEGWHGGYYSIGFMFSSGSNCFFKDVFNASAKHFARNSYQGAGVAPLYKMLKDNGVGMKPYVNGLHYIPMNIVYPWLFNSQKDFFTICNTELPKETIGIHWYAGHPEAQEFNNNINPDTLGNYNNTMSHWLGKIL